MGCVRSSFPAGKFALQILRTQKRTPQMSRQRFHQPRFPLCHTDGLPHIPQGILHRVPDYRCEQTRGRLLDECRWGA